MADFEPLEWGIRFKNLDGGQAIEQTTSQLKNLSEQIRILKQQMDNMPSVAKVFGKRSSGGTGNSPSIPKTGGFSLKPELPSWMNQKSPSSSLSGGSSPVSGLSLFSSELTVAAGAIGALAYAGSKAYDALMHLTDNMVKVFSERESSIRTYKMLLGNEDEAKKQYFREASLAQKTELTQTDVRGFSSRLITSGFRGEALERARMNIADLVTMRPTHMRAASSNQLAELYSKVQGAGYVQEGLINRTASRFVQTKLIYDEIAKSLQIKPEKVREALKERKVTSDVFFDAFQKASMKQLNEKNLGEFATNSSGSLGGLLSNLDEAQENLLRTIDPSKIEGVTAYKNSIQNLTDTITAGTASGDNLRYFLEDAANIGTNLKAIGLDTVSSFLSSFGEGYQSTMESLGANSNSTKKAFTSLSDVMKMIGRFAGEYLGPAMAYLVDIFIKLSPIVKNLALFLSDVGGVIITVIEKTVGALMKYATFLGLSEESQTLSRGSLPGNLKPKSEESSKKSDKNSTLPADLVIPGSGSDSGMSSQGKGGRGGQDMGKGYSWRQPAFPVIGSEYLTAANPYAYPAIELYRDATRGFANPMTAYSERERKVEVGEINIVVQGDGLSPEAISTEILSKLSQTFGRLSRAPSPGGI